MGYLLREIARLMGAYEHRGIPLAHYLLRLKHTVLANVHDAVLAGPCNSVVAPIAFIDVLEMRLLPLVPDAAMLR